MGHAAAHNCRSNTPRRCRIAWGLGVSCNNDAACMDPGRTGSNHHWGSPQVCAHASLHQGWLPFSSNLSIVVTSVLRRRIRYGGLQDRTAAPSMCTVQCATRADAAAKLGPCQAISFTESPTTGAYPASASTENLPSRVIRNSIIEVVCPLG